MKHCIIKDKNRGIEASCSYSRNFWDNAPDTFRGRIIYKEKGHILWSEHLNIDRTTPDDATQDAIKEAELQLCN